MKRLLCDLLAVGVLVGGVGQAQGQPTYSYTALPAAPGISGPLSFGINSTGQIVGGYFDPASVRQPFLLSGGTYTTLIPTGAFATGINDAGQIVLTIFGTIEFPF